MALIEKRKSSNGKTTYRARVRLTGHDHYSKTFSRKTDAANWAKNIEVKLKTGEFLPTPEARRRTVAEMIDKYLKDTLPHKKQNKDVRAMKQRLARWRKELGKYAVINVTPAIVAEVRDRLRGEITKQGKVRSSSTVNRYLSALSAVFKTAAKEWYWCNKNPMNDVSKLGEPKGRERFLSDDERASLLAACKNSSNPYLYTIVVLALSTGARRSELLNLRWPQVDSKNHKIVLYETKNGSTRVLNLYGHAYDLIKEYEKVRHIETDLLFPGEDLQKPSDITTAWRFALKRAGIENLRFHDLRHSAASYLAMNGATLTEIAEILGHKTLQMVKRYSHFTEQHTASVVQRMNEKVFRG